MNLSEQSFMETKNLIKTVILWLTATIKFIKRTQQFDQILFKLLYIGFFFMFKSMWHSIKVLVLSFTKEQ